MNISKQTVDINLDADSIMGDLAVPDQPLGIIIFAHGSGSSRFSPRNQFVAEKLNQYGFATLLLDLLTKNEDLIDSVTAQYRFDINLLSDRLITAINYVKQKNDINTLPVGLFGASTGSAAAFYAAVKLGNIISAVVSRGGRPDMAIEILNKVNTASLLIIGGEDKEVIKLNQQAYDQLSLAKAKEIIIIPDATHLFEEPGALDLVADYSVKWFSKYLVS